MKFLDRFKKKQPTEPPLPASQKPPEVKMPEPPAAYQPDIKGRDKAPTPTPPLTMPGVKKASSENELRLELGDFLHRIPAHLLLPGPHDLKAELRFDIADLSERITKGQTTVSLAEIYRRVPTVFRGEILESDNIDVRFPWQKLAKLVNGSKAGGAESNAAPFPALAERLRAKKPARAIKTGEPAEGPPTASTPVVPGRPIVGKQASWFTKTDPESAPGAAPQPDAPSAQPNSADMSAVPPPPMSVKQPESAPLSSPTSSTVSDAPRVVVEDIRMSDLPPEAQRRFATIKGEFERQIAEMQSQKRSIAEARDRANAEVERLKKEHDRNLYLLAKEQTSSSMGHDVIQRHQKERDELNARIESLTAQLAGSQSGTSIAAAPAPAALSSESVDEQVAGLMRERDALLEQKAYLSSQLAEMTNRRSGPTKPAAGTPQANRQLEEFQRRIALLEASQKETALELQRERDAKGKIEKLLANADRLQQESALHMEETKIEMRKELEIAFKKNVKELEDQLAALRSKPQQAAEAAVEAEPPAWQSDAISQLEADIESYRERIKTLIRERDDARSAAHAPSHFADAPEFKQLADTLAKAQSENESLRAEIEDLRNTNAATRGLHAELDSSRHRIAQLQAELSEAIERARHGDSARSEIDALHAQFAAKNSQVSELEASLTAFTNASTSTDSEKDARIRELSQTVESLQHRASEAEALQHELANARADHSQSDTLLVETRSQLTELRGQFDQQAQLHAHEVARISTEKETQIRGLTESLDAAKSIAPLHESASAELTKLRTDFEDVIARHNAERTQFEFDRKTLLDDRQKLATQLQDQIQNLQQQLQTIASERDNLVMEKQALHAELRAESEAHEELLTTIDKDHTSVVQAKEQLVRQLAAAEEARRELELLRNQSPDPALQAEIARLRAEVDEARRAHTDATHALELRTNVLHQNETALSNLTAEHQKLTASLQEFEHFRKTNESTSAAQIQELEKERNQLASRLSEAESALASLSNERTHLASSLANIEQLSSHATSSLSLERDELRAQIGQIGSERDMLVTELSASRKQHQQLIASLDNERGELVVAHEAAQKKIAETEQQKSALADALRQAEQALEAERGKAGDFHNELNNQFHAQAAEIEKRHASELAALRAELDSSRQLLADLRNASAHESESLSGKNAALEARIAELESKHVAELQAAKADWEQRLSATESERTTLQASLKEVADYERTIATLRADREQAVAALATAERIHINALTEAEQRYRDGLISPARELEQVRVTAETLKAELLVARKMQGEVVVTLDKEREQFAATKADWEKKLESVDEARRQTNTRLDDREQAIRLLEEKLAQSGAIQNTQKSDLAELRNNLDAARRENDSLGSRTAATERQLRDEIASLTQKVEALVADKQSLNARIADLEASSRSQLENLDSTTRTQIEQIESASRTQLAQMEVASRTKLETLEAANNARIEQLTASHAAQLQQLEAARTAQLEQLALAHREELGRASSDIQSVASAREQVASELESERARRQAEIANAIRERDEALRTAGNELAKLEQELARAREQRDLFKREKDDLARRISQVTEQQKRMLDDISAGLGHSAPSPARAPQASFVEVTAEEGNINLQRVRPVQVRPPQVKVL